MAQKYKVFIDNVELFFFSEEINKVSVLSKTVSPQDLQSLTEKMSEVTTQQCQIISDDPKRAFKNFFKSFVKIKAAGGLVFRNKEMLFIHRNNKWDLPKGKVEKKESSKSAAVREVMEECGLLNEPKIKSKIINTYHVYSFDGKSYLKKTSWFLMDYEGSKKLVVQKEEGITSACWVNATGLPIKLKKSYPSIAEVLKYVTL
jgi:8-oxo-dGTP pyrophosphatase MutT (NUDIX family)